MNARERIDTAVGPGKPDRAPVVPIMDAFSARYGGSTQHDMYFDIAKADPALERTLRGAHRCPARERQGHAGLGHEVPAVRAAEAGRNRPRGAAADAWMM